MVDNGILWINPYPVDNTIFIDFPNTQPVDIEDITWPRGDTKFFFECWKYFTSECSERVKYFFQHEKRNFVSPSSRVMFYLLYTVNTNELPNHFALIVFWCERRDILCSHSNGDIFTCEDNMLFSHVKISSFRPKAHLAFHWCFYNTVI